MLNLFNKNRIKSILFLFIISVYLVPVFVFAQSSAPSLKNNLENAGKGAQYDTDKAELTDIADLVGNIIGAFFALLGIIFLGYILYGGWIWMSAKGDEQRVTEAKNILRNAIIGIIILVGAYAITSFVLTALEGFNSNI